MKRKGRIRQIEWDISWKWMKRQRAYCRILLCVAILACVLLQLGFLITGGITETLIQHRKDIYGEWEQCLADMDAESERIIQKNPFLTASGVIRIYGVLGGNYWENKQLNIGTIDETAWKLGHLQMLRGRLPEKGEEIAMEYSTLTALGYEGTVGEKVSLNIIPTTERQKEQLETIHTYTLCGVIKDYQINWNICSYERFPTGILTEDGAKQLGIPLQTHMLICADQNAETVYKDLENSSKVTCSMEENVKWEEAAVGQIPYLRFLKFLRLLTAAGAFCILYLVVSKSVEKRQEMWGILNVLGMMRRQMYGILFWETAACFLLSILIGSVIGTCIYQLAMPVWGRVLGYALVPNISQKAYIGTIAYSFIIFLSSYFFSCMKLKKKMKGGTCYRARTLPKKEKKDFRLTPFFVVLREWRYRKLQKCIQILLLASVIVVGGIGYLELRTGWESLEAYRQYTGNGYLLKTDPNQSSFGITNATVQKLSQMEGIETIETYHSTEIPDTDFTIDLSAYKESLYVQNVLEVEGIFEGDVTFHQMQLHALGVDRWEDLQRFLIDIQEGSVTKEQFESGDFCILVLAPLRKQDGIYLPWSIKETVRESDIKEEKIGVGDRISIAYHGSKETQKKELRVDAILRASSERNIHAPYPSGSGIYMITGKDFWKQYGIDSVDEECQIVRILLKDTADVYDTETHILSCVKKEGYIQVTNYHEEYQRQQQEYYSLAAAFAVFGVLYGIMAVIVVGRLRETEQQDKDRNYQIWKALGMEDSFLKKARRVETRLECAIAVAAGAVVVLGYYLVLVKI